MSERVGSKAPKGNLRSPSSRPERWGRLPLHPLLLAVYPCLAILSANWGKIDPMDAVRAVAASVLLSAGLALLGRVICGDWRTAAVLTSWFLLLFFTYGHVYHMAGNLEVLGETVGRHRYIAPLWLALLAGGWFLIFRARPASPRLTGILNTTAVVAVALPLAAIAIGSFGGAAETAGQTAEHPAPAAAVVGTDREDLPDIYYVILDMYTRQDVLAVELGYDNSAFLEGLRDRGFTVVDCARSNYPGTIPSLAASLNRDYLPAVAPSLVDGADAVTDLSPLVLDNRVRAGLEALGYTTVALETGYSPTDWTDATGYRSRNQDLALRLGLLGGVNPLESMLLRGSAGTVLYDLRRSLPAAWLPLLDAPYVDHRNRLLYELAQLEEVASLPGPKFVFVHLLAPHDPFVFGPDGEQLIRNTPFTLNSDVEYVEWSSYAQGYSDQVTYLNKRILGAVDRILSESTRPPIVILQGDHGIPRLLVPWHRLAILEALYLPGVPQASLSRAMTPVNTFRLIAREYFGEDIELLENRSYDVLDEGNRLSFPEVEEGSPGCRDIGGGQTQAEGFLALQERPLERNAQ